MKILLFAVVICFTAAGCVPKVSGPADIRQIDYTLEYGMCQGLCLTFVTAKPESISITRASREDENAAKQIVYEKLTTEQWNSLTALYNADSVSKLPDVDGCPGCADGGIATIYFQGKSGTKSIKFEEGNPPAGIKAIVNKLIEMTPNDKANTASGPSSYPPKKEMQKVAYDIHDQQATIKNYVCSRGCYQYVIEWGDKKLYDANLPEDYKKDGLAIVFSANYKGSKTEIKKPAPNDVPVKDFDAENVKVTDIRTKD